MNTVLVVEDEFIIRMDMVDHLSNEGFEVLEAANADQAIELLEHNDQIRIMFTDIDMPGSMDGLKLSVVVHNRWPEISILVTSGQHKISHSDLPEGSKFHPKPYDTAAIASSLHDIFSR